MLNDEKEKCFMTEYYSYIINNNQIEKRSITPIRYHFLKNYHHHDIDTSFLKMTFTEKQFPIGISFKSLINNHFLKELLSFDDNLLSIIISEIEKSEGKFDKERSILNKKNLLSFIENIVSSSEKSLFFYEKWKGLIGINNGKTRLHVFFMIILTLIQSEYYIDQKIINDYEYNILLYTCLFHDISKHVSLNLSLKEKFYTDKPDKIHPFKSAAVALDVFFNEKLIKINESIFNTLSSLLIKSVKKSENGKYIHSFEYLNEILNCLNEIRIDSDNEWFVDMLVLIMFHQSFDNNYRSQNLPFLEIDQVKIIFSERLFEMMLIIFVNDSVAHSYFENNLFVGYINQYHSKLRMKMREKS